MPSKYYQGRFKPKNPEKYKGDINDIVYRSFWERQTFGWLDRNDNIVQWNSEETVIPYICKTDGKPHRYFMDVWFITKTGQQYLIEIKPKKETVPPVTPKRKTKRYLQESMTYVKNQCKWEAAAKYAEKHNMKFEVWHEDRLKQLGIKIMTGFSKKKKA